MTLTSLQYSIRHDSTTLAVEGRCWTAALEVFSRRSPECWTTSSFEMLAYCKALTNITTLYLKAYEKKKKTRMTRFTGMCLKCQRKVKHVKSIFNKAADSNKNKQLWLDTFTMSWAVFYAIQPAMSHRSCMMMMDWYGMTLWCLQVCLPCLWEETIWKPPWCNIHDFVSGLISLSSPVPYADVWVLFEGSISQCFHYYMSTYSSYTVYNLIQCIYI